MLWSHSIPLCPYTLTRITRLSETGVCLVYVLLAHGALNIIPCTAGPFYRIHTACYCIYIMNRRWIAYNIAYAQHVLFTTIMPFPVCEFPTTATP